MQTHTISTPGLLPSTPHDISYTSLYDTTSRLRRVFLVVKYWENSESACGCVRVCIAH